MAQSKVGVANLALQKIGAKRISAFDEDSPSARAISVVYPDILDEVLSRFQWTFAQRRFELVLLSTTIVFSDDWMRYAYSKPSDLIRINYVNDQAATFKIEGEQILSDTQNLKIIYTFRNDDPTTYFPLFTTALATRIAGEICFNLSESRNKAVDVMQEYEEIRLPQAIAADSQQGTPVQAIQNEWEMARLMSGKSFIVQPGAQTWTPVW